LKNDAAICRERADDLRTSEMTADQLRDLHSEVCYKLARRYCHLQEDSPAEEKQEIEALERYEKELDRALEKREDPPLRKLYQPTTTTPGIQRIGKVGARGKDLFEPTNDPFNSDWNEFFRAVLSRKPDPRLFEVRTASTLTGAAGGFAVPSPLASFIYDSGLETSEVLRRLMAIPMDSATLDICAYDGESHQGTLYGGFAAQWLPETAAATESDVVLRNMTLTAHTLCLYSGYTLEVGMDSPNLAAEISSIASRGLTFELEDSVINGIGANQPLGFLSSPSRIGVSRATAGQISYTDLVNMVVRLYPLFRENALWIVNPEAMAQLHLMEDAANSLIWTASAGNVAGGQPPTLLGFPVWVSEKARGLGEEGDIILVDPSKYVLGTRRQLIFEVSNSPAWSQRIVSWRMVGRFSGQCLLDTAITPRRGTNSLSWCVTLRA